MCWRVINLQKNPLIQSMNMVDKKKSIVMTHPLDDDGFVEHFIDDLSKLTKKWHLIIEVNNCGEICAVFRDQAWGIEEKYKFEYDHEQQKYI